MLAILNFLKDVIIVCLQGKYPQQILKTWEKFMKMYVNVPILQSQVSALKLY